MPDHLGELWNMTPVVLDRSHPAEIVGLVLHHLPSPGANVLQHGLLRAYCVKVFFAVHGEAGDRSLAIPSELEGRSGALELHGQVVNLGEHTPFAAKDLPRVAALHMLRPFTGDLADGEDKVVGVEITPVASVGPVMPLGALLQIHSVSEPVS